MKLNIFKIKMIKYTIIIVSGITASLAAMYIWAILNPPKPPPEPEVSLHEGYIGINDGAGSLGVCVYIEFANECNLEKGDLIQFYHRDVFNAISLTLTVIIVPNYNKCTTIGEFFISTENVKQLGLIGKGSKSSGIFPVFYNIIKLSNKNIN